MRPEEWDFGAVSRLDDHQPIRGDYHVRDLLARAELGARMTPGALTGRGPNHRTTRSPPWLAVVVGAVGVTLIVHAASEALGSGFGGDNGHKGLVVAVFVGAALSSLVRALVSPADRRLCVLLGLGLAGWSAQSYYVLNPDAPMAFPSLVDLAALAFYVCALLVGTLLVRGDGRRQEASFWVDGLLGGLVLADLGAVFVLEQAVAGSGLEPQVLYGQLSYAVADLFVLGFVATLSLLGGWRGSHLHRLFTAAFALLAIGDSIYLSAVAHGNPDPSAAVTSLWAAGPLLLAAIVWTTRRPAREPLSSASALDLALPVCAVAVAISILAIDAFAPRDTTKFAVVLSLVVLLLATVRLVVALIENLRIAGRLEVKISDERAARQALTSSEIDRKAERGRAAELSQAITDSVVDGLYVVDSDGLLAFVNPAALRLLGYQSAQELVGRDHHQAFHHTRSDGTPYPIEDCPLRNVRSTGQPIYLDEDTFWRKDGTPLPTSCSAAPIELSDGTGSVVAFRDITALVAEREHLRAQAHHGVWFERVREALDQGRFVLYGQPIVDLATGTVVKHELLLRMLSPTGEVIAPAEFLPAAEKYGLVNRIDRWVIGEATRLAAAGRSVAANLSAESMGRVEILLHIERELARTGAPAENLTFEVTETAIMRDLEAGRRFADRLVALGCSLSLDDFGTGYGSLIYLRQLPVSQIKIDLQFIRDMANSKEDQKLVDAIVHIARSLGKTTVAEGVEDQKTLELLHDYGVDYAQGYLLGRPEPFAPGASEPSEASSYLDHRGQAAPGGRSLQLTDDDSRDDGVDTPVAQQPTELTRDQTAELRDVRASSRDHEADVRDETTGCQEEAFLTAEGETLQALLAGSKEARSRAAADRDSARSDREEAATEREHATADSAKTAEPDETAQRRDRAAHLRDVAANARDRAAEHHEEALLIAKESSLSTSRALAESSEDARDRSGEDRADSATDRQGAAGDREQAAIDREQAALDEPAYTRGS
jgi:PAS domain S-box-containing protein